MNKQKTYDVILEVMDTNVKASETVAELIRNNNRSLRSLLEELSKPDSPSAKEYLSYDEASEYLGIPKSTLYQKKCRGLIPFHKHGGTIRFRRVDLDTWLQRVPSDAELLRAAGRSFAGNIHDIM